MNKNHDKKTGRFTTGDTFSAVDQNQLTGKMGNTIYKVLGVHKNRAGNDILTVKGNKSHLNEFQVKASDPWLKKVTRR